MPTYIPAKIATQFVFYGSLVSQANPKLMQVNPTIASGDFKVSIDGGALANLATLPTVTPAGGSMVKFTLSTTEMAGANATVVCLDAAGSEWCDLTINIPTATRQVDDLAYPATSGRSIVVDASGLVDATTVKVGPTGAGTAQTAADLKAVLGAPAGASVSADIAAVKVDTAAVKAQTDKLAFTVANQIDANVIDWKGSAAPAMTGDAFARLGAPAGASVSADVASVKTDTGTTIPGRLPAALVGGRIDASVGAMAAAVLTATAIAADAITDAKVAADVTIASVTGAVGSVTAGVTVAAGGIQSSSFAAGAIDAAAIATDAIGSAELATTAVDEIWNSAIGDSTVTARQAMKAFMAALAGKASGAATTTMTFRNVADDTDVIVATVDANGNRTAITLTL